MSNGAPSADLNSSLEHAAAWEYVQRESDYRESMQRVEVREGAMYNVDCELDR